MKQQTYSNGGSSMAGKVGGLTSRFYRETGGVKVGAGQRVTAGTVLTREGDQWKPGINVNGRISLNAAIDGEIYFTKKKGKDGKRETYINVRPLAQ
jgi:ribosomal protein L27